MVIANSALSAEPRIPSITGITRSTNITEIREKFPTSKSPCLGAADSKYLVKVDFNNTSRGERKDVGAYHFSPNGNPGWKITKGFKQ